ncbi:hypothetical protein CBL_05090 [Carabus blaptoides fortunei]
MNSVSLLAKYLQLHRYYAAHPQQFPRSVLAKFYWENRLKIKQFWMRKKQLILEMPCDEFGANVAESVPEPVSLSAANPVEHVDAEIGKKKTSLPFTAKPMCKHRY